MRSIVKRVLKYLVLVILLAAVLLCKAVLLSVDEITLALFGQHIGERHDEIVEKT